MVRGKAVSVSTGRYLHECGPLGFLDNEPALRALIDVVGLGDQLETASSESNRRFLVRDAELLELPSHPLKFLRSGVLSPRGLIRLAREPLVRRKTDDTEESMWEFASRRLGKQFADRLMGPMALGIFAGDARRLSLSAAFPKMARLESEHGSLLRGAMARRRAGQAPSVLRSFSGGMQTLATTLATTGEFAVRTNAKVAKISRRGGGWALDLEAGGEKVVCDAVILASEAWSTANLVEQISAPLAEGLRSIPCPAVAVVAFVFNGDDAARVPAGFGALVPRSEAIRTLGITWDSRIFPGRCASDEVLLRTILGGTLDAGIGKLSTDEIAGIALADIQTIFKTTGAPVYSSAKLWPRAIPQYELGHGRRVADIEGRVAWHPGLFLAGNSLFGASFAQTTVTGLNAGNRAARWLAGRS